LFEIRSKMAVMTTGALIASKSKATTTLLRNSGRRAAANPRTGGNRLLAGLFASYTATVARFRRPAPRLVGAVAACAVAAAAAAGFAADRSSEATGPAEVRLTDRQVADASFGPADVIGGGEVTRFSLYGSSQKSRAIGHGVLMCIDVGRGERSCNATYILPRGMIETGGILKTRLLYVQAITGGTGVYDNARGTLTVTATAIKPRRELLLFRLTG
jgi:hypothetical protein